MSEQVEIKMELQKATMNTYRYKEITPAKSAPVLKTLYIQKFVFGDTAPKNIAIKIEY